MTTNQIDIINKFLGETVILEDGKETTVVGFDGKPLEDEPDAILLVVLGNAWTFGESRRDAIIRDAIILKSYRDNKFDYVWSDEVRLVRCND